MTLLRSLDTMTARIFVVLLLGMAVAGTLGLTLSEQRRIAEVRHIQAIRAIERTGAFLLEFEATPATKRRHEAREAREDNRFIRLAGPGDATSAIDPDLTTLLHNQVLHRMAVEVATVPFERCDIPGSDLATPREHHTPRLHDIDVAAAWKATVASTDCWRVRARLADGSIWTFVTGPPPLLRATFGPDPAFLAVIVCAAALLAFVVARIASAPLRALAKAANQMQPEVQPTALVEAGPTDVRSAINAFNRMRQRLVRHASEQTHMIAAITHDLQTPMTRLRLKLEQMDDKALRDRLLSDWTAMRAIVEEGLELARSVSGREEPVLLDVDSLIDSIVQDEREVGHVATFDTAAGRDWRCHPQMLRRCVQNLVDNAINHAGEAHLSTHAQGDGLRIEIRDFGPGIPAHQLDAVFEPMVRLETSRSRSTGGTGLGLTIARNLARQMGATISLANAAEGGLICAIRFGASS